MTGSPDRHLISYPGSMQEAAVDRELTVDESIPAACVCCTDGVIQFGKRFFMEEFRFDGTEAEWLEENGKSWVNYRSRRVICTDGVIDHGKPVTDLSDSRFQIRDGVLLAVTEAALLDLGRNDSLLLVIPEGVREIKETLKTKKGISVILPESLEKIGKHAFAGCAMLRHVEIQAGTNIEEGAFGDGIINAFRAAATPAQYKIARFNGSAEEWNRITTSELRFLPEVMTRDGSVMQHL